MTSQDCVAVIAAIAAAQVAIIGALGALWVKVRANGRTLAQIAGNGP